MHDNKYCPFYKNSRVLNIVITVLSIAILLLSVGLLSNLFVSSNKDKTNTDLDTNLPSDTVEEENVLYGSYTLKSDFDFVEIIENYSFNEVFAGKGVYTTFWCTDDSYPSVFSRLEIHNFEINSSDESSFVIKFMNSSGEIGRILAYCYFPDDTPSNYWFCEWGEIDSSGMYLGRDGSPASTIEGFTEAGGYVIEFTERLEVSSDVYNAFVAITTKND